MRLIKIIIYIIASLVVQTVVAPRLNFFGVTPDLILVSVIIYAVLEEQGPAALFAAASGCLQDILTAGAYFNFILKVIVAGAVGALRDEFSGDEYSLAAGALAVVTPLLLLLEAAVLALFYDRRPDIPYLLFRMAAGTVYNLLMVPLLFPIIKELVHGPQEQ